MCRRYSVTICVGTYWMCSRPSFLMGFATSFTKSRRKLTPERRCRRCSSKRLGGRVASPSGPPPSPPCPSPTSPPPPGRSERRHGRGGRAAHRLGVRPRDRGGLVTSPVEHRNSCRTHPVGGTCVPAGRRPQVGGGDVRLHGDVLARAKPASTRLHL